jgi:hypothetical protein
MEKAPKGLSNKVSFSNKGGLRPVIFKNDKNTRLFMAFPTVDETKIERDIILLLANRGFAAITKTENEAINDLGGIVAVLNPAGTTGPPRGAAFNVAGAVDTTSAG